MKIYINEYEIELFETEIDYNNYLKDNNFGLSFTYHGRFYGIPKDLNIDLVEIKKKCYNNIEYVVIK
jgi:ribose 1,5-bisphosphokinase PhnN